MRIILCGFGVVGQSFAKLLESRSEDLYARYGLKPRIVGVFDTSGSAIDSSGLDISKLKSAIKKKTNAIIPVHLYGNCCEMSELKKICKNYIKRRNTCYRACRICSI